MKPLNLSFLERRRTTGIHPIQMRSTLQQLLEQVHVVHQLESNLSRLASESLSYRSQLDELVMWYAAFPWWGKASIGMALVSTSYVLGGILSMAFALSGLITGLWGLITYVVENHADVVSKRETHFTDAVRQMEVSIQSTVERFRGIEVELRVLLNSLFELNVKKAESIASLETKVSEMTEEQKHFNDIIRDLQVTVDKFSATEEHVSQAGKSLGAVTEDFRISLDALANLQARIEHIILSVQHAGQPGVGERPKQEDDFEARLAEVMKGIARM